MEWRHRFALIDFDGRAGDYHRAAFHHKRPWHPLDFVVILMVLVFFARQATGTYFVGCITTVIVIAHRAALVTIRFVFQLALQHIFWRVIVDEAFIAHTERRVGVAIYLFARIYRDGDFPRQHSDITRLLPDDIVAQHRIVGFVDALIIQRISASRCFFGYGVIHKAALGIIQLQHIVCHKSGNCKVCAAAALCG